MENIISNYCVSDIQNVDENTKKLSDKELLKNYIGQVDLKPWHEVSKENVITGNVYDELYNRGLLGIRSDLLKRIQKESRTNMSEEEAFEKFYEFYWKKYKKA